MYFFLTIRAYIKRIAYVCTGRRPLSNWPVLIVLSCLTWTLIQKIAYPALDRHHDMLENYAWSQIAVWGTHKHPPFFAWVVGAWFNWVPHQSIYYKLLAYANVAVSLWGVARLAKALKLPHLAKPAVILLLWSLPYTTLAAKFNANSQLLSLWPWTAVFMLRAWQAWGWRKLFYAVTLGIWAAACFLSKYFSGVFLLGLFIASVLHPAGRTWLKTPWPYLSLLVFGLAMWPHVQWVMAHDMVTLKYMEEQGNGHVYQQGLWGFALSPILYWLPAWLVTVFVGAHAIHKTQSQGSWLGAVVRWARQSWMPRGWSDTVFWLALIPWAISLVFGITSFVNLSTAWAIPIGYAFPLLWLRNFDDLKPLSASVEYQPTPSPWFKLDRWVVPGLLSMLAFSLVLACNNAWHSEVNYYRPAYATAKAILNDWKQRHPDSRLTWAGGDWAESGLLSFYGDPTLIVIPDLPGSDAASFYVTPDLTRQAGLIFCSLGPVAYRRPDSPAGACEVEARQWLESHHMPVEPIYFQVSRKGWRFPEHMAFEYVVFHVLP